MHPDEMKNHKQRPWVEHASVIARLIAHRMGNEVPIGGRFLCEEDAEDDPMAEYVTSKGLNLHDAGQWEVVAARIVRVSSTAIGEIIAEMRRIASESGYRLQSVEAGDFEGGKAHVLASEEGYIPWWEMPTS